jgi:ribosomal protein S18 acetylase RimI-like enzyme
MFNEEGLRWVKVHCQQGRIWVVKVPSPHEGDDKEIAGVMLITPPTEPAGMKTEHHEVFWLAVDPAYRKRGVGLSLLRHAKTLHDTLVAKAQESNAAVRALLERERFQVAGVTQLGGWVPYDWLRDEDEDAR